MNLKSVKLDDETYHEYLEGKEVHCDAEKLTTKNLAIGEHVLVYKDTTAVNTNMSVPKREMQAEYIGIEGIITQVSKSTEHHEGVTIKKL